MSIAEKSQSVAKPEAINRRVLIVDDDEAILATYRSILQPRASGTESLLAILGDSPQEPRECFEVATATQGQAGVALVREALSKNAPFSVAFLDMRMPPGWDGLRTAQAMRTLDPDLYIVVASAYADYTADQIQNSLNRDTVLLRKPFGRDEVYQLTRTLAQGWTNRRALQDSNRDLQARIAEHVLERKRHLVRQQILTDAVAHLVCVGDWMGNLSLLLEWITQATKTNRCYLATWSMDGANLDKWCVVPHLQEDISGVIASFRALLGEAEGECSISATADVLVAPLFQDGRLQGLLACEGLEQGRAWSTEDQEVVMTFAHIIAVCFAQCRQ